MTIIDKSISFSVQAASPGGGGSAPTWVKALPLRQWAVVQAGNTIASLDPKLTNPPNPNAPSSAPWSGNEGLSGLIEDWCGGFLARNVGEAGVLGVWGGGHHGYFGNEVYGFDIASRLWSRLTDPCVAVNGGVTQSNGYYAPHAGQPNGSPGASHTYHMIGYDPVRKCVIVPSIQSSPSGPVRVTKPAFFPFPGSAFPQYQWQRGTLFSGGNNPANTDGWMVYDPVRKVFLCQGDQTGSGFARFDPSVGSAQDSIGAWTSFPTKIATSLRPSPVYEPNEDVVLLLDMNGVLRGFDPKNLSASSTTLVQAGGSFSGEHVGLKYSPARGAVVRWSTGGNVHELRKGAGAWNTATWTWSLLTDSANSVAPASEVTGTYGRFQVCSYVDAEMAICINGISQMPYAFRLG